MNNYNLLEKIIHKIVLSSQLMREVSFDLENALILAESSNNNHVFITGLARSGTTILLNALYKSNIFASLTYADMPFILAPNLWYKISSCRKQQFELKERAHGDGIKFSIKSPEAFEEVFWKTFSDKESENVKYFKIYINNILKRYVKKRYLSKNNQNIRRLRLIADSFPHSKILVPYRRPIQHAYSLLTQHKKFIQLSKQDPFISTYMNLIGHNEFGPSYKPIKNKDLFFSDSFDINHWIEQWNLIYGETLDSLAENKNIIFINYEKLCVSKEYWFKILEILNIKESYDFEFRESKKENKLEINFKLVSRASNIYNELSQKN